LTQQVEIDAALAALEIEIHASSRSTADGSTTGEERVIGRQLLAHDDNLFPLAWRSLCAGIGEFPSAMQELLLVTPDEEHFEELELQIASVGLTADSDANQIGSLIVQAIRHVEIGLGQRVTLIEVDGRLAADRLVGRNVSRWGCGWRCATRET